VSQLVIQPGERLGVLGTIGSGKSTLLRLLSGIYTATEGRVHLDGLDLSHISRDVINRHIGYLQQEHRLFQGTLRENLLIGMPDPGDVAIMEAMARTGMDRLVRSHPQGLERMIAEGGKGLSGGQRQLLAFTRLLLTDSNVLLLDEPTANMDQEQENRCLDVLTGLAQQGKTMIIVTHKPTLLPLVDRLVVVSNNRIVLDGPKQDVLNRLSGTPRPAVTANVVQQVAA
jgi:ATP-binding cassette, subfamily C, bacterial LapB